MLKHITKLNTIAALISTALFSQTVFAQENDHINTTIDAFTQCDSQFFRQLNNFTDDFNGIAPIINEHNIAYFHVKDTESEDGHTLTFEQPINYKGLTLSAYQDIYIQTPWFGQYYYWGFVVNNSIDEIKQAMKKMPWQQYSDSSFIAHAQLYDTKEADLGWQDNPYAIDGVVPHAYTVEKSLYLEAQPDGSTLMLCSIQGDLNDQLLSSIRPDVKIPAKPATKKPEQSTHTPESVSL